MPNKAPLKKKEFDIDALVSEESANTEYKPQEYYHCGEAFLEATGLPGPAIGHLNMFIGHSDSGKTAAMIKAIIAAQKRGDLPVLIITEEKWSFEHAQLMGMDTQKKEDGQWKGFYIFRDDFAYVEQITDYINHLLNRQEKGEIPYNLAFFWDSIGSVPCQLTYEGKGGKQHTAGVLADKIGMGLNRRISSTRKATKQYTNTLVSIVQPWVFVDMKNPMSQPKMEGKGGKTYYMNSTLVFRFGNIQNAGIYNVSAVKQGRKIKFATHTKISVVKNHINGLGFEDGKIIVTPHDFIPDTKAAIDKYKKEYSDYWRKILDIEGDFDLVDDENPVDDDMADVIIPENDSSQD
jgi:hypothetical protein